MKSVDFKIIEQGNYLARAELHDGKFVLTPVPKDKEGSLSERIIEYGGNISYQVPEKSVSLFYWVFALVLIIMTMLIVKRISGGSSVLNVNKSKAKIISSKDNKTNFSDVAGCDEAKEEVYELVKFLKSPSKFKEIGAKIPCGVLMTGSPGTGKTLLARAIAGEANVPFYSVSGSDFVEMFIGVGASRVRDMFADAKKNAPCIIFIDEIDAVGRKRDEKTGNQERDQTLNQLLVEMDGFSGDTGVIIIAASNRPDVLDPALSRPGRFDRHVFVPLPDIYGREKILEIHMRKIKFNDDVNAKLLARGTPGFSGADLGNLVNESALYTARNNRKIITMADFEHAKEKILMGAERKSVIIPDDERKNTAYHESGHAVVARLLPDTDPVHKVTIIPRGSALGVTMQIPEKDRYSMSKNRILSTICVLLAGRVAEELFMKESTTGASNDFQRVTKMANAMVTQWGMSEKIGPIAYPEENLNFIKANLSDETATMMDQEIREIIDKQYKRAEQLLKDNKSKVEAMVTALMEWETIDETQINDIMSDKKPIARGEVEDITHKDNENK